jgi:hypothetical protein
VPVELADAGMSRRKKRRKAVPLSGSRGYTQDAMGTARSPVSPIHTPTAAGSRGENGPHIADSPGQHPQLARLVPVFAPQGEFGDAPLFSIPEHFARQLLRERRVALVKLTRKLSGLRILPEPPPTSEKAIPLRRRSVGSPHCRDSKDNVVNCWTIESPGKEPSTSRTFRALPTWLNERWFQAVIINCAKRAA